MISLLPGLTAAKAVALEGTWADGGLWDDVCWLAQRFWQEQHSEFTSLSWHHLVLGSQMIAERVLFVGGDGKLGIKVFSAADLVFRTRRGVAIAILR
jgi:hypothetical protein